MTASPAADRIEINGLVLTTLVGALPHERESAQPIRVDLSIHTDLHDAGTTDDLDDTVDYGSVVLRVSDTVREAKDVLLERLADRVAETVLAFVRADAVDVTMTKLRPPIPAPVDTTSVRIHRDRSAIDRAAPVEHDAVVALGSNLGDRVGYLRDAMTQLGEVTAASQVFETAPIGGPAGQGPFLNMVVRTKTTLDPFAFLRRCLRIEANALRQRVQHWGPRTLDVDVLFFDDVSIDSPELTVPHPRHAERRFVLAPLAEVAPERCPPGWETSLPPDPVTPIGPIDGLVRPAIPDPPAASDPVSDR